MYGAGHHLTPTQLKAHERSKAFRAKIEHMAALLNAPVVVPVAASEPVPVVDEPEPASKAKCWFEIIEAPINFGRGNPSLIQIRQAVAAYYNMSARELFSIRRTHDLVIPRRAMAYLCKELTMASFPQVARYMNRDHSSIMNAVWRAKEQIAKDWMFAFDIACLTKALIGDRPQ